MSRSLVHLGTKWNKINVFFDKLKDHKIQLTNTNILINISLFRLTNKGKKGYTKNEKEKMRLSTSQS